MSMAMAPKESADWVATLDLALLELLVELEPLLLVQVPHQYHLLHSLVALHLNRCATQQHRPLQAHMET